MQLINGRFLDGVMRKETFGELLKQYFVQYSLCNQGLSVISVEIILDNSDITTASKVNTRIAIFSLQQSFIIFGDLNVNIRYLQITVSTPHVGKIP